MIKKVKTATEDDDDKEETKGSAWKEYMRQVKQYKDKFGDDDSDKNRPLVK